MQKKNHVPTESAQEHLRELQLGYFVEHFKEYADEAARKQIGHLEYLDALAEGELADRMERRIARRIKEARIPVMRSLERFDWTHPANINRQQVEMLMRMDFLKDSANVVFIGPCGVGKSFLASCLVEKACRKGIPALFAQAVDIVNDLLAAQTAGRLPQAMRKYCAPALLCIDELGYLPLGKDGCNLLFQVFSKRYEQKSTIVTTNKPFKNWGEIFNDDSTAASAIIDRIVHHCEIIKIEGTSYRMRDKAVPKNHNDVVQFFPFGTRAQNSPASALQATGGDQHHSFFGLPTREGERTDNSRPPERKLHRKQPEALHEHLAWRGGAQGAIAQVNFRRRKTSPPAGNKAQAGWCPYVLI